MTHLDNLIADALAQSPDTVVHQLASEVVRLRSEIADLKRGGVVISREEFDLLRKIEGMWLPPFGVPHNPESIALFAALRALPADRVLREGEARIGMNELQMLRCFAGRRMSEREYDRLEAVRDAHEEALRANQGSANGN